MPVFLEKISFYRSANVFYLSDESRCNHIVKNASADDIAIIIDKAVADTEERNEHLQGVLPQNFYSTLGANKESIKKLIDETNKIDIIDPRYYDCFFNRCLSLIALAIQYLK